MIKNIFDLIYLINNNNDYQDSYYDSNVELI